MAWQNNKIKEQDFSTGNKVSDEKKGKQPEWKGSLECAAWENQDKNGEPYLALSIGGLRVNLFRNKPKLR